MITSLLFLGALGNEVPALFIDRSLRMELGAEDVQLSLIPAVQIEGAGWLEPAAADCHVTLDTQSCSIPAYGILSVEAKASTFALKFQADRPLTVLAIGWRGTLHMPGAAGWLSHGFQSWSQTGVIQLQKAPSERMLQEALQKTGEDEVDRRGSEMSWWYSFVGSDRSSFLAGASTADRLRSYVQFHKKSADVYDVHLISGAGERVELPAQGSVGETWTLSLGSDLQAHLDRYAKTLASRRLTQPRASLLGWNSWYDLWDDITQDQFFQNIEPVQEFWQARRADRITMTLDDGWEEAWGDWYPNEKFPLGVDGVAKTLQNKGLQLGLWLAPLLVHPKSNVARQHPDWLVKNAEYRNPMGMRFRVLDVSQPLVAAHLQETIRRLVGWGAGLLKIDFLFAGALEGGRSQAWTGMQAYHEALRLIREAAGEDTVLVAVGAPPLATFDMVDAWRVGGDIAFKPLLFGWPRPAPAFIANQARSLAGRQPYCQITLCDADPALLRTLSQDEVQAGIWVAAAAGGAMVLSDHLPHLDRQRWHWGFDELQLKNGLSGQPARLLSYFPPEIPKDLNSMKDRFFTAEQKVPEVWILPDGTRVGINFGNGKKMIEGILVPKNASRVLP